MYYQKVYFPNTRAVKFEAILVPVAMHDVL